MEKLIFRIVHAFGYTHTSPPPDLAEPQNSISSFTSASSRRPLLSRDSSRRPSRRSGRSARQNKLLRRQINYHDRYNLLKALDWSIVKFGIWIRNQFDTSYFDFWWTRYQLWNTKKVDQCWQMCCFRHSILIFKVPNWCLRWIWKSEFYWHVILKKIIYRWSLFEKLC